jgi:hypothetical protein
VSHSHKVNKWKQKKKIGRIPSELARPAKFKVIEIDGRLTKIRRCEVYT